MAVTWPHFNTWPSPSGFIPSTPDALLHQLGQNMAAEAAKMRIHDIERHLAGVEAELMLRRHFQHPQMHQGIFVPGESDEPDLAGFLGFEQSFQRSIRRKETVRIFQADIFVELHQVHVIGFQALAATHRSGGRSISWCARRTSSSKRPDRDNRRAAPRPCAARFRRHDNPSSCRGSLCRGPRRSGLCAPLRRNLWRSRGGIHPAQSRRLVRPFCPACDRS